MNRFLYQKLTNTLELVDHQNLNYDIPVYNISYVYSEKYRIASRNLSPSESQYISMEYP